MHVHVRQYNPRENAVVAAPSGASSWRQHLSVLLPLLLLFLALACYRIDAQSLWVDEVLSIRDAASAERFLKKSHGPLYFALLHVWMEIGTSEPILRALSVLVGAVALCLFYATSLTLVSRQVTLFATALLATSPFLIWYSQEVRYITLMLATSLLAMYSFQQLSARGRPGWWLVYGGAVLLAIAAFVSNVLLPLVHGLYLVCSPSRRPLLRKWLVCQMIIGALFMWWVGGKFLQRTLVTSTVSGAQTVSIDPKQLKSGTPKQFSPLLLPYTLFTFSAGFSQGPSVYDLHLSRSLATLRSHAPVLVGLGILFGGLALVGLVALWHRPEAGKLLLLWLAVPVLGVLGISALTNFSYNVRYVTMALPAYLLILASGLAWFRRPVVQVSLLAVVLLSNGVSLANYYHNPRYAREDARAAVRYLAAAVQPRDLVLVIGSTRALRYYAQDKLELLSLGDLPPTGDSVVERVQALQKTKTPGRLWIVEVRPWAKDPTGKISAALDKAYDLLEHQRLPGVDIYAYTDRRNTL